MLPLQLYEILLVPPLAPVKTWATTAMAELSDCSCFTLLFLQQGWEKLLHNPPKGLESKGTADCGKCGLLSIPGQI